MRERESGETDRERDGGGGGEGERGGEGGGEREREREREREFDGQKQTIDKKAQEAQNKETTRGTDRQRVVVRDSIQACRRRTNSHRHGMCPLKD